MFLFWNMKQLLGKLSYLFTSSLNWIKGRFITLGKLWRKRPSLAVKSIAITIQELVTAFLKLGTLFLVGVLTYWLWSSIGNKGYVIEPFNVPKHLEESGYDGSVLARKIQDQMFLLKEEAGSMKEDSLVFAGNESPDLNLSVMSVGLSLNSLTHHIKNLLGRKNYFIKGDVTYLDSIYGLTLRMTDFDPIEHQVSLKDKSHGEAIDQLFRQSGESILMNTDPYRLAVVYYKKEEYDKAIRAVNKILEDRPNEAHWAYIAWGSIVEKKGDSKAAPSKFKKAVEIKPGFELGWYRLGWAYDKIDKNKEAEAALSKAMELAPDKIGWHLRTAWYYHGKENYEKADSIFQYLVDDHPTVYYTWSSWADSKLSREEVDDAIALLEESQKHVGHSADGLMTLAFSSYMKKDTTKAFDYMAAAYDLSSTNSVVVSNFMQALTMIGNYDRILEIGEATNWDEISGNHYKQYEAKGLIANAHNNLGEYDEALSCLRKAISEADFYDMLYVTLAETHAYQGQVDSFYYYLEFVLERGYNPKWLILKNGLDATTYQKPFDRFMNEQRFIDLIEKYRTEHPIKG